MKESSVSEVGFCGLLTIAFVVLKLTKIINWSWIWVISPIWIPIAIVVPIYIALSIVQRKAEKEREEIYNRMYTKQSKFMQKLDEIMEQNKANKEQKLK